MKMPGFTAEASLSKSNEYYVERNFPLQQSSREIIPQFQWTCRLVCYRFGFPCDWVCTPGPGPFPE
jgi:hypothetical protein